MKIVGMGLFMSEISKWVQLCKNATSNISYPTHPNVNSLALAQRKAFDFAEIGEYKKSVADILK